MFLMKRRGVKKRKRVKRAKLKATDNFQYMQFGFE